MLHDIFLGTLSLSCNHSLLHAAFCVPLVTVNIQGLDSLRRTGLPNGVEPPIYREPSYAFSPVESELPVPGASYSCARHQQAFAYEYLANMQIFCPGCTALGTYNQRIAQPAPSRYSRESLAEAACSASIIAVRIVKNTFDVYPIMGITVESLSYSTPADLHRDFETEVYNSGSMVVEIRDCTCAYCQHIHSKQRFPTIADDGQHQFDIDRLS